MEIKELLANYKIEKKGKAKSELDELRSKFVERLNSDRVVGGYKPLKAGVYIIRMAQAGIKSVRDLHWLWGYCNDAKSFGTCWWWWTRENKKKKND